MSLVIGIIDMKPHLPYLLALAFPTIAFAAPKIVVRDGGALAHVAPAKATEAAAFCSSAGQACNALAMSVPCCDGHVCSAPFSGYCIRV
jgi:hypothetical protein